MRLINYVMKDILETYRTTMKGEATQAQTN